MSMHLEGEYNWELKCEEEEEAVREQELDDDDDVESKCLIKFYLLPDSSYKREWWFRRDSEHRLLYKIEELVDVAGPGGRYVENIDAADIMSSAPDQEAALITLISEKVLIGIKPAAAHVDNLKKLASLIISESRRLIINRKQRPGNNKKHCRCSFSIGIYVRYNASIDFDESDMELLEQLERMLPPDCITLLKPLPILTNDGYKFTEEESCAICLNGFLAGSRIIRKQCLHKQLDDKYHHHHQVSDHDIFWIPCSHKFHANCITNWFKITNSCPLCRFQMPSRDTLLAILCLFQRLWL